jgi:hypothetical protein
MIVDARTSPVGSDTGYWHEKLRSAVADMRSEGVVVPVAEVDRANDLSREQSQPVASPRTAAFWLVAGAGRSALVLSF